MKNKGLENKTREIFHRIHVAQGKEQNIFNRLSALLSTDYLGLPKDFFTDKICLDAGCGSNANATFAMLKMGAKKVYAFDLDNSIYESVPKYLCNFKGKYDLSTGNVLKINFEDNFFDFVHCAGVLHHTLDGFRGMKELARVTKTGGGLYISVNGKGGIIREVTNFFRKKYKEDIHFKRHIDTLNEKHIIEIWEWIMKIMREEDGFNGIKIPTTIVKKLIDKDLILTIKDRITAPLYNEYTEAEIIEFLSKNGFVNIKRLKRYPKIKNIRRFLCPFYYRYDHDFSRFLYGEGFIQIMAEKLR